MIRKDTCDDTQMTNVVAKTFTDKKVGTETVAKTFADKKLETERVKTISVQVQTTISEILRMKLWERTKKSKAEEKAK